MFEKTDERYERDTKIPVARAKEYYNIIIGRRHCIGYLVHLVKLDYKNLLLEEHEGTGAFEVKAVWVVRERITR